MGSPLHSTPLGSRVPQWPRHTGTQGGLQAKATRNYHLHHPLNNSPTALPWPTESPETVRKLVDLTRSQAKATMQTPPEPPLRDLGQQATQPLLQTPRPPSQTTSAPDQASQTEKGRTRPQPSRKNSNLPTPRIPPDPPGKPGPSILVISPPIITTTPAGPGILIILPPATSTAPTRGIPRIQKGCEGPATLPQRPHADTGDWIWCEGTIQYHLRELGDNGGAQIRVVWHRQKQLDQGSSAPDKPEGHTLELTSAHPIRLCTDENKAHRGTKYTWEPAPEWSQGLPPPRLPKRPPPGKRSPGPSPPP